MAALTQHEVPAGIVITPVKGQVLVRREPAPQGPSGSLLRGDQVLGIRQDTGVRVLIDPARALAFKHMRFEGVTKAAAVGDQAGEWLLVPEAAILATVGEAPAEAPPPPPTPRKRREAPAVETVSQSAARAAAEAAAKQALEEAATRSAE